MNEETLEQGEAQETTEEVGEATEEVAETTPTLEDYERLLKENKTLKAQKEHFKKKATQTKEEETNKTNTQSGITRDEAILYAKGLTEEEVELANKIAQINGVSAVKATEDPYFKAQVEKRQQEEKNKKAQLGASSGGGYHSEKPVGEMSDDEHKALFRKIVGA